MSSGFQVKYKFHQRDRRFNCWQFVLQFMPQEIKIWMFFLFLVDFFKPPKTPLSRGLGFKSLESFVENPSKSGLGVILSYPILSGNFLWRKVVMLIWEFQRDGSTLIIWYSAWVWCPGRVRFGLPAFRLPQLRFISMDSEFDSVPQRGLRRSSAIFSQC